MRIVLEVVVNDKEDAISLIREAANRLKRGKVQTRRDRQCIGDWHMQIQEAEHAGAHTEHSREPRAPMFADLVKEARGLCEFGSDPFYSPSNLDEYDRTAIDGDDPLVMGFITEIRELRAVTLRLADALEKANRELWGCRNGTGMGDDHESLIRCATERYEAAEKSAEAAAAQRDIALTGQHEAFQTVVSLTKRAEEDAKAAVFVSDGFKAKVAALEGQLESAKTELAEKLNELSDVCKALAEARQLIKAARKFEFGQYVAVQRIVQTEEWGVWKYPGIEAWEGTLTQAEAIAEARRLAGIT